MRVLEEEIGQATMLRCLQTFVKEHPKGEAAEWADFARIVSKVTGQDYDWFFAQWTRRKGLPHVHLENVRSERGRATGMWCRATSYRRANPTACVCPYGLIRRTGRQPGKRLRRQDREPFFGFNPRLRPPALRWTPNNLLPLAMTAEQGTVTF